MPEPTVTAGSVAAGAPSKAGVSSAIDNAEYEFRWCLSVLTDIKAGRDEGGGDGVVAFQSRLVDALFALESVYGRIKQEERRLIARKARLNRTWFGRRMAALSTYCAVLQNAIAVGRAIGDGFAWMFYERDRNLIAEHLKHDRQIFLPSGLGGLGERMTVKNLKGLENKLVLYHGTTSFLRLGDVSLVDLETMRVAALGEIKTRRINENEIGIRIELVAEEQGHLPVGSGEGAAMPELDLPPAMKTRFERQLRRMDEAVLNARDRRKDGLLGRRGDFHYKQLDEVVASSHHRNFEYRLAGPSLIIGAWRKPGKTSLSRNLFHKHRDVQATIEGVETQALKILDPKLERNALVMGWVGGDAEKLVLAADEMPLVWWQVSDETLEDLLFGNVMVFTLYNPAHFWHGLQTRGFEVEWGEGRAPEAVRRVVDGRAIELFNYDYFNRLVQNGLMSLDGVLGMIDLALEAGEAKANGSGLHFEIRPQITRSPRVTGVKYSNSPAHDQDDV